MRRGAVVCVVALTLLAGCASSGSDAAGPQVDDGVIEPATSPGRGLPSGIVTTRRGGSGTATITVWDVTTGTAAASAVLPAGTLDVPAEGFDAAMRRLAFVSDCELRVATLTDSVYVPTAQWKPPQAYGQGKQCFDRPAFHADGRLWASVTGLHSEPGRVFSADPAKPTEPLRDEGADARREEQRYRIVNLASSDVRVYARGAAIDQISVTGEIPGRDVLSNTLSYECAAPIDEHTFACSSERGHDEQYFGSVAVATVDPASKTVTMKQVAPASQTARAKVVVAPDHRRVAISDSTGWYTATLDGKSAPVRQPLSDVKDIGDVIFWH